jgi:hypothetical protein
LVPALDHLSDAQLEGEGLLAVQAATEPQSVCLWAPSGGGVANVARHLPERGR